MSASRILILGATGMLGHKLFAALSQNSSYEVLGAVRTSERASSWFSPALIKNLRAGVDADNFDTVIRIIAETKPEIVINCIGIIKQTPLAKDPLISININALFPHKLAFVCKAAGARLIHISTDCVFNGAKGSYTEEDPADAEDLYGKTKNLGEVTYPHCVTLRTSIIGHELKGKLGLMEWYVSQKKVVKGYTNVIFSGFPTIEVARIIDEFVIPRPDLRGLYHVSSPPVAKYDLLKLVAEHYKRKVKLEPYDDIYCDRSLDSSAFKAATGYQPPGWPELVEKMHDDFKLSGCYNSC
jgi:dTDP-4-dehydrorhamnose reductase